MDKPIIEMRVGEIVLDPGTQAPIVVLRGVEEPRLYLPMYIGGAEANAIATALSEIDLPRPMTHDLMASVLDELGAKVARVVVTDLIEGTFYAEITIGTEHGHQRVLDARPSDCIALALRTGAAIYASREVLAEAGSMSEEVAPTEATTDGATPEAEAPPLRPITGAHPVQSSDVRLEDLDPETFGEYKM